MNSRKEEILEFLIIFLLKLLAKRITKKMCEYVCLVCESDCVQSQRFLINGSTDFDAIQVNSNGLLKFCRQLCCRYS